MPSFFSRFVRVGRLPGPLRERLDGEGIIHVAERVPVRQRFSGSIPGTASALSVRRHTGLVVFTRARLYALLPTVPRLNGPAIDQCWDAEQVGAAKVTISGSGVLLNLELGRIDPRFHGDVSLQYKTTVPDDVLTALPQRPLRFDVEPEYVFHMLGVRVRD
jgi:hypothetical protein